MKLIFHTEYVLIYFVLLLVRETETQVNWTHSNVNDSLANNGNAAQVFMLNDQPPPYSECIASDQSSHQLSAPTDYTCQRPNLSITPLPL